MPSMWNNAAESTFPALAPSIIYAASSTESSKVQDRSKAVYACAIRITVRLTFILTRWFLVSVSASACYCIPQCVRLIAGDWCLHVVD